MTENHPITPPEDKFKRWEDDILNERENVDVVLDCVWKDGYRAGADAELEACCEWCADGSLTLAQELRAARRPKPPSLAEGALELVDRIEKAESVWYTHELDTIRRALERLQELESNG